MTEWERAKDHHYNMHSRHFPIEDCSQPECRKAVRDNKRLSR